MMTVKIKMFSHFEMHLEQRQISVQNRIAHTVQCVCINVCVVLCSQVPAISFVFSGWNVLKSLKLSITPTVNLKWIRVSFEISNRLTSSLRLLRTLCYLEYAWFVLLRLFYLNLTVWYFLVCNPRRTAHILFEKYTIKILKLKQSVGLGLFAPQET